MVPDYQYINLRYTFIFDHFHGYSIHTSQQWIRFLYHEKSGAVSYQEKNKFHSNDLTMTSLSGLLIGYYLRHIHIFKWLSLWIDS